MREKKTRGPEADQQTGPKHMAAAKRLLKCKKKEVESPEARLLLSFLGSYPPGDTTLRGCEMTWAFIQWLKERRLYVVSADDVFCVPFSHLAKEKDLK